MADKKRLGSHPYANEPEAALPKELLTSFAQMHEAQETILALNVENPIDAIVADDVSGRVPTLISHNLFRLGQAAGHFKTIPRTFFMASGRKSILPQEMQDPVTMIDWQDRLDDHAEKLVSAYGLQRILLITDIVASGHSIGRLSGAFDFAGAETGRVAVGANFYLQGYGADWADRHATGVEKAPPSPVTVRRNPLDDRKVGLQRDFIHEYSRMLYMSIMRERAPSLEGYTPTYATQPTSPDAIGVFVGQEAPTPDLHAEVEV